MAIKLTDKDHEPPMSVYPLRLPDEHLDVVRRFARKLDRTRQSLIREAIREWVERKTK